MQTVKQIVVFKLGNVQYGFPIEQISEIINYISPVEIPNAQEYVEGVISLREKVYAVINLRNFLGMEKKEVDENTKIIVSVDSRVGFAVDEINMIVTPKEEEIDTADELPVYINRDYLLHILKIDGEITIVLNMSSILAMSKNTKNSA